MLLLFISPATLVAVAFVLSLLTPVIAQTTTLPPASECFESVTFSGCDTLSSKINECSNLPSSSTSSDYAACFCTQEVFNAITE